MLHTAGIRRYHVPGVRPLCPAAAEREVAATRMAVGMTVPLTSVCVQCSPAVVYDTDTTRVSVVMTPVCLCSSVECDAPAGRRHVMPHAPDGRRHACHDRHTAAVTRDTRHTQQRYSVVVTRRNGARSTLYYGAGYMTRFIASRICHYMPLSIVRYRCLAQSCQRTSCFGWPREHYEQDAWAKCTNP